VEKLIAKLLLVFCVCFAVNAYADGLNKSQLADEYLKIVQFKKLEYSACLTSVNYSKKIDLQQLKNDARIHKLNSNQENQLLQLHNTYIRNLTQHCVLKAQKANTTFKHIIINKFTNGELKKIIAFFHTTAGNKYVLSHDEVKNYMLSNLPRQQKKSMALYIEYKNQYNKIIRNSSGFYKHSSLFRSIVGILSLILFLVSLLMLLTVIIRNYIKKQYRFSWNTLLLIVFVFQILSIVLFESIF